MEELFKLIPQVDLTSPEKIKRFKDWQNNDGSEKGLRELLEIQKEEEK